MFLDDDYLIDTEIARKLYHNYAEFQPIIDYHCHLDPKEIYEDKKFDNLTQIWLGGDHYKWRLMRANGLSETLITGDASDYDKYLAYAKTICQSIGNPLYIWTHLELKRIFGITEILNEENAPLIWEKANKKLQEQSMSARNLIVNSKVETVCTTDDPISDLGYHKRLKKEEKRFKVLPTFRPDRLFQVGDPEFRTYIDQLAQKTSYSIKDYQTFLVAIDKRIDYFDGLGGRLSDHSFTSLVDYPYDEKEANVIFKKALHESIDDITLKEKEQFTFCLLVDLFKLYDAKNWTVQLHLGATRNNNTQLFETVGADVGGDGMSDNQFVKPLTELFKLLNQTKQLPKTIVYPLNPNNFTPLMTALGCFQDSGTKGKLQLGSAWWYNDTYNGMRDQLITVAEGGILSNFVGMLTDSRSFLSYPRHEYFRRIVCQLLGQWVAEGQFPDDMEQLGDIISRISYKNAKEYFQF